MPKETKKRTFIGVSGITPDLLAELREQAQRNNRSLSGELRHILQAHLSRDDIRIAQNTEPCTHTN